MWPPFGLFGSDEANEALGEECRLVPYNPDERQEPASPIQPVNSPIVSSTSIGANELATQVTSPFENVHGCRDKNSTLIPSAGCTVLSAHLLADVTASSSEKGRSFYDAKGIIATTGDSERNSQQSAESHGPTKETQNDPLDCNKSTDRPVNGSAELASGDSSFDESQEIAVNRNSEEGSNTGISASGEEVRPVVHDVLVAPVSEHG